MNILLKILFIIQLIILAFLVLSRKPARLPGFEKAMNQSLDRIIFGFVLGIVFTVSSFKVY